MSKRWALQIAGGPWDEGGLSPFFFFSFFFALLLPLAPELNKLNLDHTKHGRVGEAALSLIEVRV